jgi:hypothetical protein
MTDVERDARRYRWLRDHEDGYTVINGELAQGDSLDKIVDEQIWRSGYLRSNLPDRR